MGSAPSTPSVRPTPAASAFMTLAALSTLLRRLRALRQTSTLVRFPVRRRLLVTVPAAAYVVS